jgi:23S rRNA maturation-related 3'-5' exoribonuclease YhaM
MKNLIKPLNLKCHENDFYQLSGRLRGTISIGVSLGRKFYRKKPEGIKILLNTPSYLLT